MATPFHLLDYVIREKLEFAQKKKMVQSDNLSRSYKCSSTVVSSSSWTVVSDVLSKMANYKCYLTSEIYGWQGQGVIRALMQFA